MKRLLTLLLCVGLLLVCWGCGGEDELYEADFPGNLTLWDAPDPTPTLTPEPTPTPVPYVNPLNGAVLDAPYTGRIFAVSVSNISSAIPHNGLIDADVVFESFVNGNVSRLLALYTDISAVDSFGGVRSTRPMWQDIVQHYDAFLIHSGGHPDVLEELSRLPIDHYNIDSWTLRQANCSYRAKVDGRPYENCLMGTGVNLANYATNDGMEMTKPAGIDYGLVFTDEGTPANGAPATTVDFTIKLYGTEKSNSMKYDASLDAYVFWQYDREMWDLATGKKETFKNVLIMNTDINNYDGYHHASFTKGGDGYYFCGGQATLFDWTCDGQDQPFRFYLKDGSPLELERGNTYIALAPNGSPVSFTE